METKYTNSEVIKYTLAGAILGIVFPFLSTNIELLENGLPLNFSNFMAVQKQNPLLWIIDSAILILGFFGYQIGIRQRKLVYQAVNLEDLVSERSEEILRQKLFYEALVENSPIAIVTLDQDHCVISINPAFQRIFGYRSDEIMGKNLDDLVGDPENMQEAAEITKGVIAGKTMHEYGKRRRKDGALVDVEILGEPIKIDGKYIGVLGLYRDITIEKKATEDLQNSEKRFRRMFEDSPVALRLEDCSKLKKWTSKIQAHSKSGLHAYLKEYPDQFSTLCKSRNIISVNLAALSFFKATSKKSLQDNLCTVLSEGPRASHIDIVQAFMDGETSLEKELIYKSLDGVIKYAITKITILPGYEDTWSRVLFSNMDITERKLSEERLSYISFHDMITGVFNRAFYEEEMKRMEKSRLRPVSIIVGDMDNLKLINDKYGHQAGDKALKLVADVMKNCLRSEDLIARIGGDEFAILLPNVDENLALKVKQRILDQIEASNQNSEIGFPVHISLGCGMVNNDALFMDVFKQADAQMYQEKQRKKGKVK
jgi:diguanylate cyclase (GGDEF)-like protein/PAS domain S-box-containing protein